MRVLVCGGRMYGEQYLDEASDARAVKERDALRAFLSDFHSKTPISVLIHGVSKGADFWADNWAKAYGVKVAPFKADWRTHGKGAGPIRNKRMLEEGRPDIVVAFPGGRGTLDMCGRARAIGLRVLEVK